MALPERFSNLPDYAFPRLRKLLDPHAPGAAPIAMTIGEPRHPMPDFVGAILAENLGGFGVYPPNDGAPELLEANVAWVQRRYGVTLTPDNILSLNGTREGLFNAAIALCPETKAGQKPVIAMPNPFYQVYAVAALTIGAEPLYVNATAATGHLPDYAGLPPEVLNRLTAVYLCSPANPQGVIAPEGYLADLMALAETYDFRIFSDECYSEIWRDAPPPGALQVAATHNIDPERVAVFHSLSKRSNMPGLRSGFVASGVKSIAAMRSLRNFAGAPLPLPLQKVATAAWSDEAHVQASLKLYQDKFALADATFASLGNRVSPEGGFFLWLPVPHGTGEEATLRLWRETGVRVLPGEYLSRDTEHGNPGRAFIRVAMVAPQTELAAGLTALRDCLYG